MNPFTMHLWRIHRGGQGYPDAFVWGLNIADAMRAAHALDLLSDGWSMVPDHLAYETSNGAMLWRDGGTMVRTVATDAMVTDAKGGSRDA